MKKDKVSNEKKNLSRLAGEFLVASRLAQRGYMIALQWGQTIGYDILVFDKKSNVAFLEVKSTASHHQRWILQAKYARHDEGDSIPQHRRFVCCVDLTVSKTEPQVYVFPARVVEEGLKYFYAKSGFSASPSYVLSLKSKPRGRTKDAEAETVGTFIEASKYLERFQSLDVSTVEK
jgi:Holliday junction resolvase-like predicted endonuclease